MVGDHGKANDRLPALALRHKSEVLAYIPSLNVEAGAADPDSLTREFALLIGGAIVTAMVTRDADVANIAGSALRRLLEPHIAR